MTAASPSALTDERGPSLMTRVAAVAVVLALAGIAAYAMFSGPTTVPAPSGAGTTKAAPSKAAPAGEEQAPEAGEGADGR
jgi:hypothetical protein